MDLRGRGVLITGVGGRRYGYLLLREQNKHESDCCCGASPSGHRGYRAILALLMKAET